MFKIIRYEDKYRDDAIFCLLLAKDSLGGYPKINPDLLDIQANYFDKGDMFWLAIDENGRVVGMVGTHTVPDTEMWLKRLYIKPNLKRKGLGSALLATAEHFARQKGVKELHSRFANYYTEAAKFYLAKGFAEVEKREDDTRVSKKIVQYLAENRRL